MLPLLNQSAVSPSNYPTPTTTPVYNHQFQVGPIQLLPHSLLQYQAATTTEDRPIPFYSA